MTVIHNHPHHLAQKIVEPINQEVLKRFGAVRVEDWDDRISGQTWGEQLNRGSGALQAQKYWDLVDNKEISQDQPDEQRLPNNPYAQDIVRCHSPQTGEVILLHTDWLPGPDQGSEPSG